MEISFLNNSNYQISKRCLRCFDEQQWYAKNFLFDFIGDKIISNQEILEIGCAEAGLLKFYDEKGAICSGIELSDIRYKNALLLNKNKKINIFQADICNSKTFQVQLQRKFDTVIIRDVIEHIKNKNKALSNIYKILKPGGKLFMSFPPKYSAYAGHQQTIPQFLGKLPYIYLLPDYFYIKFLRLIACPQKKINYLISTKNTRISIYKMDKLINLLGFNVLKKSEWIFRPAYSFRFGLPKLKNYCSFIPFLNEFLTNGVLYLLEKPKE